MKEEANLVRTVRFSAGHHYGRPGHDLEENRRLFGRSATPHGHNFGLVVRVRGVLDDETGFVVHLEALARWFFHRLAPLIPGDATLVRVRLSESDALAAEFGG